MSEKQPHRGFILSGRKRPLRSAGSAGGYSLLEVLVAMAVFGLALVITTGAFLAILKQSQHAESSMQGSEEVRLATHVIAQAVRSAPQPPIVQAGGRELLLMPKELGSATVLETTWIDLPRGVKGSKANQRMLHVSNLVGSPVTQSVFAIDGRPSGALTAGDVATYFIDGTNLPVIDLNEMFSVGDVITIPATAYGSAITGTINSISNNPGAKTLTLKANLGVDVPNGTRIGASSGRRLLFVVQETGELLYHPDHRDRSSFTVLGRNIDPAPRADPTDPDSARTVPFAVTTRIVTINLQRLPPGTVAGRTVEGAMTRVLARTDPLTP